VKTKMPALDDRLKRELAALAGADQQRVLKVTELVTGVEVRREGRVLISFSGNDYLGLSQQPEVIAAGQAALTRDGVGAGASRLITGNHPGYAALEARLAAMKKTEAALVVGSGYLANLGAIPALVGKGDLILADRLVHACILDGAALSGATLKRFKHNDMADLERLLATHRGAYAQCLVATDHVFSMDGDIAPLPAMRALCDAHDAILMVDDAHGLGIVKPAAAPDIWMGTLSKAAGGYGGYLAGSRVLIDYLTTTMRSFIFSTALPPATIAAADAALALMTPALGARPFALARRFTAALNLPSAQSAIVPLILGDAATALAASRKLEARGFLVSAIRPPTVPQGTARLRVTFSALHDEAMVDALVAAIKEEKIRP
jgi:8-amino-7-oxononanoate synthase